MSRSPWTPLAGRAGAADSSSVRWFGKLVEVIAKLSDPSAGDSVGESALGARIAPVNRPADVHKPRSSQHSVPAKGAHDVLDFDLLPMVG